MNRRFQISFSPELQHVGHVDGDARWVCLHPYPRVVPTCGSAAQREASKIRVAAAVRDTSGTVCVVVDMMSNNIEMWWSMNSNEQKNLAHGTMAKLLSKVNEKFHGR